MIETFRSRVVIDIWVLAHFVFKTHKDFMQQIVLTIYFGTFVPKKSDKEKNWNYDKMLDIHKDF